MSSLAIRTVTVRLWHAVALKRMTYDRKRTNAIAVRHLETLPAYLLKDIGLAGYAEIEAAVEQGRPLDAKDDQHWCAGLILPHAA